MEHDMREPMQALDRTHWLTEERLRVYPRIFLVVFVVAAIGWAAMARDLLDSQGKPLGYDFITFWAASLLTLGGEPGAAYDFQRIFDTERVAAPALEHVFLWHYPPTFELVVAPLSLLPYIPAYLLWVGATLVLYLWVLRRLAPTPLTTILVLSSPGVFINLMQGQTGFLIAALYGGALLLLDRRPILAGILIGLLSCKPHFGLLIPFALLLGGYWRTFLAAAVTTILFAGLTTLILGTGPWLAFYENMPTLRLVYEDGLLPWIKMPSLFIGLRMLGVGSGIAYGVHGIFALGVALLVWRMWWRRMRLPLTGAALVCGSLLVTPYAFDYDLALLAVPIALLALDGHRHGWLAGEREILVAAWLSPFLATVISAVTQVQVGFLCVLALFVVAVRRGEMRRNATPEHATA